MDSSTRLSVLEARNELIGSLVKSSIGWTLLLTAAVVGSVLVVNSQFAGLNNRIAGLEITFDDRIDGLENRFDELENRFDGLENRFDGLENRFDGLHELLPQHIALRTDYQVSQ